MAYIGRDTDKISNVEVLDNITFDGSSSYTLQKGGSNFTPSSANTLLVSIDGVVQAGNFTVSGSTIDFGTAVAGTSTCDFILHYGIGLITAPSDGTVTAAKLGANSVTAAKLNNDIISGTTALTSEPADTDEFLVSDAGTLKRIDYSLIKGGGITEADMYRLTADLNSNADPISSNLERVDDATFSKIGTGMSVSSGRYTFPSTGLYFVQYSIIGESNNDGFNVYMDATTDNSSYDLVAQVSVGGPSGYNVGGTQQTFINVTDTSNVKVSFRATSMAGNNNTRIYGDTDFNATTFTFIRLGDSQ
jgi:hypothetical protein